VASFTKTFTLVKLTIVQDVERRIVYTPLSLNVFVKLATQQHLEYSCKALFETPCIYISYTDRYWSVTAPRLIFTGIRDSHFRACVVLAKPLYALVFIGVAAMYLWIYVFAFKLKTCSHSWHMHIAMLMHVLANSAVWPCLLLCSRAVFCWCGHYLHSMCCGCDLDWPIFSSQYLILKNFTSNVGHSLAVSG
jgi:hypothetical protein